MNRDQLVAAALWLSLTSLGATAAPITGHVTGVADGDSITVVVDGKPIQVRLANIDAPEKCQESGLRAKTVLTGLVMGKDVRLDITGKDQHGRTLALVSTAAIGSVNDEMVDRGAAWVFRRYTNDAKLLALEARARRLQVGLWAEAEPMAPWDWRASGFGCHKQPPRAGAMPITRTEPQARSSSNVGVILDGMAEQSAQGSIGAAYGRDGTYGSSTGGGSSASSHGPIYTGPKGGQYYMTPAGNKQYIKK